MDDMMNETFDQARHDYSLSGWALLVIALLTSALQVGLAFGAAALASSGYAFASSSWFRWLSAFAPLYLIGFPVGYLILRRIPAETHSGVPMGGKNFFTMLLICFPIMYGGNIIGILLSSLLSGGTAQNGLDQLVTDPLPLRILVMVILAPLTEEFIFRKQLIDRCHRYGEKMAILFSALTFGLFHMNLFQFFYAFGLGLVFGYVYTRTGRLRYTVIFHMTINFIGSILSPALLSTMDAETMDSLTGSGMDVEAALAALSSVSLVMVYSLLILAAVVIGLILLIIKAQRLVFIPSTHELPQGQRFKAVFLNPGAIVFTVFCLTICVLALL